MNKKTAYRSKHYMLVEVTMFDMREMMKKKVYGVPAYIAVDDDGKCYVYPLCHQEIVINKTPSGKYYQEIK